jgi:Mg2+ and Co2+ transporter CorA
MSSSEHTLKQIDPGEENDQKPDPKKAMRDWVNLILPDSLMIFLAVLLIPVVIVRLIIDVPAGWGLFLTYVDDTILGIFILEYVSKAILAKNIFKHIINPWHLLDLLVVLLPLIDLLQISIGGLGRSSPLLRLIRIARVLAVGGRTVDRKVKQRNNVVHEVTEQLPVEIRALDKNLGNIQTGIPMNKISEYLHNSSNTWIDVSSVSKSNISELSSALNIPQIVLENGLIEDSYPHIDYFGHYSTIFARIPDMQELSVGTRRLLVEKAGLLVICAGQNIITVSKTKTGVFDKILEKTRLYHTDQDTLVVTVLYAVLKYILEKDREVIAAMEKELMIMENIPLKERPPDFLEATFHLKKEVNQLVPSLLHMKEITSVITSKRVPLEGFNEKHEKLFDILGDEATYLHETAESARDNLLSLIDLYINTTSFELNRVMRIIAVITCLGIIPALCGLFGSNIVGNPWDIELWQLFAVIGFLMLAMGWIFYRLGWLKW